jgi:hypothetical protein
MKDVKAKHVKASVRVTEEPQVCVDGVEVVLKSVESTSTWCTYAMSLTSFVRQSLSPNRAVKARDTVQTVGNC